MKKTLMKIGIFCTVFGILLGVWANIDSVRIFSKNYLFLYYGTAINKFLYPNKYDDKCAQKQQAKGIHKYFFMGKKPITFNYLDENIKDNKRPLKAISNLIKKYHFGSRGEGKKVNFDKIRSIALAPFQHIGEDSANPDLNVVGIFIVERTNENEHLDFEAHCTEVMKSSKLITTQDDLMEHLDSLFSRRILIIGSLFLIFGCILSYYGDKKKPS